MRVFTEKEEAQAMAALLWWHEYNETPEQKEAKAKALQEFRNKWVGRTFKCTLTGEIFIVPESAYYRDYYTFGQAFLDLGDGYYARYGGSIVEVKEEGEIE